MSKIQVDEIVKQSGSTLTLGGPGTAVTLGSGATQTGFGRTGTVDWCTTAKTSPFTAVSGDGFFVNTTSGAITVTLPSSPSAGDIVSMADYANTWHTNSVTICRNGSKLNGVCAGAVLNTQGQSITLIYVDGTRGWKNTMDSTSDVSGNPGFTVATGGTITTSGDFKIHTFTGDGSFVVTNAGTPLGGTDKVSYMVVAGGGGGGGENATTTASSGGGAGGFREGKVSTDPYTASPLAATPCSGLTITGTTTYPITVGGGGTAGPSAAPNDGDGGKGEDSVFSTITSTGGGFGSGKSGTGAPARAGPGGSGGGAKQCNAGGPTGTGAGAGNDPPVAPPQGNPGGKSDAPGPTYRAGGGGGATAAGGNPTCCAPSTGSGGAGATTSINATPTAFGGGGGSGASTYPGQVSPAGAGGAGGGGAGAASPGPGGTAGTVNTGGGGGGGSGKIGPSISAGGAGGSGIVIIRYKFQ
jgi:hypothetical protein